MWQDILDVDEIRKTINVLNGRNTNLPDANLKKLMNCVTVIGLKYRNFMIT